MARGSGSISNWYGLDGCPEPSHAECMPKRLSRRKTPKDPNELAAYIVEQATAEPEPTPEKNPAAVTLGRLGGKKGALVRAARLTAAQRSEIARRAAETRWRKGI